MMKSNKRNAAELEAELERLATLVRERREQLKRLEECPNPACPCRVVWHNHVEKGLADQMGKIGQRVRTKAAPARKAAATKPKAKAKRKAKA